MIALLPLLLVVSPDCDSDTLSQAEINACQLARFHQADARLNTQWKRTFQAYQQSSPEDADRLRAAQRAWIGYRDAECDAEHPLGGSMDKMLNIMCRTNLTDERTDKLRALEQDI